MHCFQDDVAPIGRYFLDEIEAGRPSYKKELGVGNADIGIYFVKGYAKVKDAWWLGNDGGGELGKRRWYMRDAPPRIHSLRSTDGMYLRMGRYASASELNTWSGTNAWARVRRKKQMCKRRVISRTSRRNKIGASTREWWNGTTNG